MTNTLPSEKLSNNRSGLWTAEQCVISLSSTVYLRNVTLFYLKENKYRSTISTEIRALILAKQNQRNA